MTTIDTGTARREFAEVLNRVRFTKEPVTLTRYGKACAAIVPLEVLEELEHFRRLAASGRAKARREKGSGRTRAP
jgi:prevent-host-death family protein